MNIKNTVTGKSEVLPVRIPAEYKHMLDEIARRFGKDRNYIVKQYIIDGIERTNTDTIAEHSKIWELNNELKDFLSVNISKVENRLASLLSKMLISVYEDRAMGEEILKLIVRQIYEEDQVVNAIDEVVKKVNTSAIVKIKSKNKFSQLEKEV